MRSEIAGLKAQVCELIERGGPEARFNDVALQLFRWHLAEIPRYRAFCENRVAEPSRISDYRAIPALPVEAFKHAEITCVPERVVHRFSTSGTSRRGRGPAQRGVSAFDGDALEIMEKAIEVNAGTYLFPDRVKCRIFVLAPRPSEAPHMIMAYGMRHLMSVFGDGDSDFFAGASGLDVDRLIAAIQRARTEAVPVCLIGASFAFVHLLDALASRGESALPLPPGSRLMDAGGYKGRSRELSPESFREVVGRAFALSDGAIVNLLGMTELSSQIYDNALADATRGTGGRSRRKVTPTWMRTRVASVDDPTVDAPSSELGFLVHYDLANFSRPIAVLSDDLGQLVEDGFHIVSRVKSSEPRGCSVSVDELWRHS